MYTGIFCAERKRFYQNFHHNALGQNLKPSPSFHVKLIFKKLIFIVKKLSWASFDFIISKYLI